MQAKETQSEKRRVVVLGATRLALGLKATPAAAQSRFVPDA